jgi:hypothetical protein
MIQILQGVIWHNIPQHLNFSIQNAIAEIVSKT